jgi:hypothetical protein
MLKSFLQVLDRQGRLKGDLSWSQRNGLAFLMRKEIDEEVAVEKVRLENHAFASNPQTSAAYVKHILEQKEHDDELQNEVEQEGYEIDWHTPKDASEVEDVLRNLGLNAPTK